MTWMVKRLAAVVLLLMILYYIVFGNVAISGIPGTRIVPGMKNSRILTCGFSSECSKWQRQGRDIRRGATVWRR